METGVYFIMPRGGGQKSPSYIAGVAQHPMGCWRTLAFSFAVTYGGESRGKEEQAEEVRIFEKDADESQTIDSKKAGAGT